MLKSKERARAGRGAKKISMYGIEGNLILVKINTDKFNFFLVIFIDFCILYRLPKEFFENLLWFSF